MAAPINVKRRQTRHLYATIARIAPVASPSAPSRGELRAAGVGPSEGTSVDVDERAAGGFAKASAPVDRDPAGDRRVLVDAERTHILRVLESCYWTIEGPGETAERLSLVVKIQEIALRQHLRKLLRIREFIENSRTCFHRYRHAPAKRHVPRRPEKRGNRERAQHGQ